MYSAASWFQSTLDGAESADKSLTACESQSYPIGQRCKKHRCCIGKQANDSKQSQFLIPSLFHTRCFFRNFLSTSEYTPDPAFREAAFQSCYFDQQIHRSLLIICVTFSIKPFFCTLAITAAYENTEQALMQERIPFPEPSFAEVEKMASKFFRFFIRNEKGGSLKKSSLENCRKHRGR